jgi:hypothetical protein
MRGKEWGGTWGGGGGNELAERKGVQLQMLCCCLSRALNNSIVAAQGCNCGHCQALWHYSRLCAARGTVN